MPDNRYNQGMRFAVRAVVSMGAGALVSACILFGYDVGDYTSTTANAPDGTLGPDGGGGDGTVGGDALEGDAGRDAPPIVFAYHDMQDAALWATFDLGRLNSGFGTSLRFYGGAFDGRYVYLVPRGHGTVVRYDTEADAGFADPAPWETFDTNRLDGGPHGFEGAGFDGRYLYFAPNDTGGVPASVVVRFDTRQAFTVGPQWETFDARRLAGAGDAAAFAGFAAPIFDGKFVTFVPFDDTVAIRYETDAGFSNPASWSKLDLAPATGAVRFASGTFDGRLLYMASWTNDAIAVYDTDSGSLLTPFQAAENAYSGSVASPGYVTFVPSQGRARQRVTSEAWAGSAAIRSFDVKTVDDGGGVYVGGTFDQKYVYFAPENGSAIVRVEPSAFSDAAAWSVFPQARAGAGGAYWGGVFDGRYVYFVPVAHHDFLRFDARTPKAPPPPPPSFL
jgi:hypothetical protein